MYVLLSWYRGADGFIYFYSFLGYPGRISDLTNRKYPTADSLCGNLARSGGALPHKQWKTPSCIVSKPATGLSTKAFVKARWFAGRGEESTILYDMA